MMLLKWRVLRPVPAEVWVLRKWEIDGEYVCGGRFQRKNGEKGEEAVERAIMQTPE